MEIDGSVIILTGASSGIGEATARAASKAGARVALLARRADRIEKLASELENALAVPCDVTDAAQIRQAVAATLEKFGRIDGLVNNAGQGLQASVEEIDPAEYRSVLELNVVAPLLTIQAVIPIMKDQGAGSIVNVSSGATFAAQPGSGAYTSSKCALNMLSDVARLELADAGIAVSTMYPFITATEFYDVIKGGEEAAGNLRSRASQMAQPPELVAEKILELIRSGEARADLVPAKFGGSFQG
ncbi:SDR family oxidoreductase [Sphingobium phenoxybenzoativorans]|uniref:SDR family oxidoreductase n=1 Tax=Sphingobium phenoxybenzoativorans TaxID=1592790 RepID=UPI000871B411|nr:SDR family oxidoreductase [Sphingobium phenoxybenzoativorans]